MSHLSERSAKEEAAVTPPAAPAEEEAPKAPARKGSSLRARMKERLAKAKVGQMSLCVNFFKEMDI